MYALHTLSDNSGLFSAALTCAFVYKYWKDHTKKAWKKEGFRRLRYAVGVYIGSEICILMLTLLAEQLALMVHIACYLMFLVASFFRTIALFNNPQEWAASIIFFSFLGSPILLALPFSGQGHWLLLLIPVVGWFCMVGGFDRLVATAERVRHADQNALRRLEAQVAAAPTILNYMLENRPAPWLVLARGSLPQRLSSKTPFPQFPWHGEGGVTCAICLDDLQHDDLASTLPCGHTFHTAHIKQWLTRHSRTCPNCRREVTFDANLETDWADNMDLV
eukprot:TRINITY_DN97848_c0_g1_i1.p1 TRINITY_DN97848_c0_g1~~TRINITY_DN97848_c0_g1_i1.p1  ORF type:complete len:277 (+),score=11.91 TRINITY_DN97848_c0_g1_i1:25-855(+)